MSIDIEQLTHYTHGKYKFERVLGNGAYGVVFAAVDTETGHHVAVKFCERIFNSILEAKRILREIKILGILRHENIIGLIDVYATDNFAKFDSILIVFELMDSDLHQIIYRQQKLTVDHRSFFAYQILRALKHVHSANIIHRNLRPSNLLISTNCDLKICGFRLACVQGNNKLFSGYEERWYRAPEDLLLCGTNGPEIDIWSVGCIMAELILRQPLFPGKEELNQLSVIVQRMGSPTESDLSGLTNVKARKYMESLPHRDPVNWSQLLRGATNQEVDLISKMLLWDPTKRITADEAIKHPFFEKLHDLFDEPVPPYPVDEFDFERDDITKDQMRNEIWREIIHYNQNSH